MTTQQTNNEPELTSPREELVDATTLLAPDADGRGTGVVSVGEGAVLHNFDLRPPLLKLSQPTSELGTPGQFRRIDTEEELGELMAVPLRVQATRTKWPPQGFSRDRLPECASYDGVRSISEFTDGRMPRFVDKDCRSCEFYKSAPWMVAEGEEYCQTGYSILLMDIETFEVFGLRLQGTATRVAPTLGAKPHLRKAVIRLWGEKTSSDRGSWYQLKATMVRKLTDEEIAVAESQFDAYGIEFDEN